MSHMVIFRSAEGKAGYHQADGLEDATRFVERLRNSENVEQARIFRMEEVGFEYRSYFRVEVAVTAAPPAGEVEAGPEAVLVPAKAEAAMSAADDISPEEVGVARRGLFSR